MDFPDCRRPTKRQGPGHHALLIRHHQAANPRLDREPDSAVEAESRRDDNLLGVCVRPAVGVDRGLQCLERRRQLLTLPTTIAPPHHAQAPAVHHRQEPLGVASQESHFEEAVSSMNAASQAVLYDLHGRETVKGKGQAGEHRRSLGVQLPGRSSTHAKCTGGRRRGSRSAGEERAGDPVPSGATGWPRYRTADWPARKASGRGRGFTVNDTRLRAL